MCLNPHISEILSGTMLNYKFRGDYLTIGLYKDSYTILNFHFNLISKTDFGFCARKKELEYFKSNNNKYIIYINGQKYKTLKTDQKVF